jgi:hypothetical protein
MGDAEDSFWQSDDGWAARYERSTRHRRRIEWDGCTLLAWLSWRYLGTDRLRAGLTLGRVAQVMASYFLKSWNEHAKEVFEGCLFRSTFRPR